MSGALAGLRVIDCSRLIAGGVLATVLADHGANVIKVENPRGGDPLRTWLAARGELWWKVYARGKRSITLNLAVPRARRSSGVSCATPTSSSRTTCPAPSRSGD
jgi:crotonobetainyl-CoA:carnitine CoA-transferase CaiB-like acyl-CoA transferase